MLRFFLSVKTSLWFTGACALFFLIGSVFIPRHLDVFSEINDMPLFRWLSLNTADIGVSFWLYPLLACMALLAVNLIVCTADALVRRTGVKRLIAVLSPQILHAGVLFVLLGHLVSAAAGYKEDVTLAVSAPVSVRGFRVTMERLEFVKLPQEDTMRWIIHLDIDGVRRVIEPARPAGLGGVTFLGKSADRRRMKAIVGIIRDPGVLWEVIGAVFFTLGAAGLLFQLSRPERDNG